MAISLTILQTSNKCLIFSLILYFDNFFMLIGLYGAVESVLVAENNFLYRSKKYYFTLNMLGSGVCYNHDNCYMHN